MTPQALLKQALPFLAPSLSLRRRPQTLQTGVDGLELIAGTLEAGVMDRCHPVRRKELGSSTPKSIALCLAQSSSSLIFQSHG